MKDFSLGKYVLLLNFLISNNYHFHQFQNYNPHVKMPYIILRHDVDRLPQNALKIAQLESALGIYGTYYFRIVSESFDQDVLTKIAKLGHEIGYHYEDIDLAVKKQKALGEAIQTEDELIEIAIESFVKNLEKFRSIYPVKTICMHGSPMSKYDNRLLWTKYKYWDHGIIGEPYFDVDFSEVAYYTDTGRRWDGTSFSVRDKVIPDKRQMGRIEKQIQNNSILNQFGSKSYKVPGTGFPKYRSTNDIIKAINSGTFPKKAMITIHPQRWHDSSLPWVKEILWQNIKNKGKWLVVRSRYK